jgi:ATP-binding cassette subfamily B protein RaxB
MRQDHGLLNPHAAHAQNPPKARILVGGKPMSQIGLSHYRGMFGAVLQDDRVLTGSIADNIAFWSGRSTWSGVKECAKLAQLHADIQEMAMVTRR